MRVQYYTVHGWMLHLGISHTDVSVLSVIYGFSHNGTSRYFAPLSYLQEAVIAKSKNTVISSLKRLIERKLIIKFTKEINGIPVCEYSANLEVILPFIAKWQAEEARNAEGFLSRISQQEVGGISKIEPPVQKLNPPISKIEPPRSNFEPINKNNIINKTLTPSIVSPSHGGEQGHVAEEENGGGAEISFSDDSQGTNGEARISENKGECQKTIEYTHQHTNAPCGRNLAHGLSETPSIRTLAKNSARRILSKYPRRESGLSIEVCEIFVRDLLHQREQEILESLERWKQSEQWRKENGKFIPSFSKFIRQEIWQFSPEEQANDKDDLNFSEGFIKFWMTYPAERRIAKEATFALWNKKGCEDIADRICERLKEAIRIEERKNKQDGFRYFPAPRTYILERRWADNEVDGKTPEEALEDFKKEEKKRKMDEYKAYLRANGCAWAV